MRRVALFLVVPALFLVSCGSKPESAEGPGASTGATSAPGAKAPTTTGAAKATTTTKPAAPTTTIKKTDECLAYQAFSLAYSALVLSTPATYDKRLQNYSQYSDNLKTEVPSLAAQLEQLAGPLRRTTDKTGTPADKEQATKLVTDVRKWFTSNCF